MNDYEKKQRRKAYALFYVRQHSKTAYWARKAYRLGLGMVAAILILTGIYAWHIQATAMMPALACSYIILVLAFLAS